MNAAPSSPAASLTARSSGRGSMSVRNSTPTWVPRRNASGMARNTQPITPSWVRSMVPRIEKPSVRRVAMSEICTSIAPHSSAMPA